MRNKLLALLLVCLTPMLASATAVRARLIGTDGKPLAGAYLQATLQGCSSTQGPLTLVGNAGLSVQTTTKIIPSAAGIIAQVLIGNDQLLCGGTPNTTSWLIASYNGTTLVWLKAYVITGASWDFDNPVLYPPITVAPSTPLLIPVVTNSAVNQSITQQSGSSLSLNGSVIINGTLTVNGSTSGITTADTPEVAGGGSALSVNGVSLRSFAVNGIVISSALSSGTLGVNGKTF